MTQFNINTCHYNKKLDWILNHLHLIWDIWKFPINEYSDEGRGTKFASCCNTIKDLDESGKTEEDIIKGAGDLCKQKVEFKPFFFKHCWLLLWT